VAKAATRPAAQTPAPSDRCATVCRERAQAGGRQRRSGVDLGWACKSPRQQRRTVEVVDPCGERRTALHIEQKENDVFGLASQAEWSGELVRYRWARASAPAL